MSSVNKFQKKIFFMIICTIVFYIIILVVSDFSVIVNEISKIKVEIYLLTFPLVILNVFLMGIRFHYLLKKINISLDFKDSILILFSSLPMMITPGGIGTMIKSYFIKVKTGDSFSKTSPIIIYEKWLELISTVIIIGLLLFWYQIIESQILFIIGAILAIGFIILARQDFGVKYLNKIFTKLKLIQKIDLEEFHAVNKIVYTPKIITVTVIFSLIIKFITMVIVFLVFDSLSLEVDIFQSSQIFFTASLAGVLSLIPGGLVVVEGSLLGLSVKEGIMFATASVLVIMLRFASIWFASIIGAIIQIMYTRKVVSEKN